MLLFCKLATTDKLHEGSAPQIVSMAAELTDKDGQSLDFIYTRVRASMSSVKPEAQQVHGISSRMASRDGVSVIVALGFLCGLAAQARYLIGHAVTFDRDVAVGALEKLGKAQQMLVRPGLQVIDLMVAAAPVCRIPSGRSDGQHKWPSLNEACEIVLHEKPQEGPRDTWVDLGRAKRLYLALRDMNVLEAA